MTKFISLLTAAILLVGCTKENQGETTVYGYVYTKGTNQYPSDSATELGIQYYASSGGVIGGGWNYLEKFETNDQGYYSYTFNAQEGERYRIVANKGFANHYHPYSYSPVSIANGSNQQIDLEIAPYAYLQLHVRNKIDPQIGDELRVNWGGGQWNSWNADFNDTVLRLDWGNTNLNLTAFFYRDQQQHKLFDTIYLPAFDTTYYLIDLDL